MKNLIKSLQDFNHPSAGKRVLMDVHASLDSLLLLYRSDFKRKRISTLLNYDKRLPQILAIPDQIKQVILNLLNNATDACLQNGGLITISTWHDEKNIAIAIEDNGVGIPPEEMQLIFRPFYTTKPEVKGIGLGLSVCHGIVQNHQGAIHVESQPGKGSTFTVLLPAKRE
jgi:signal transduction histidine kinase